MNDVIGGVTHLVGHVAKQFGGLCLHLEEEVEAKVVQPVVHVGAVRACLAKMDRNRERRSIGSISISGIMVMFISISIRIMIIIIVIIIIVDNATPVTTSTGRNLRISLHTSSQPALFNVIIIRL